GSRATAAQHPCARRAPLSGRCPGGFRPWRAPYPMRAVMLSMATPRLEVHRLPDLCPHRHLPRVQPPCSHSSDEACMELSLVQQRPPFRAQSSTGTGRRRAVRGRAPWARWTSDQPCLLTQASSRASGRHQLGDWFRPADRREKVAYLDHLRPEGWWDLPSSPPLDRFSRSFSSSVRPPCRLQSPAVFHLPFFSRCEPISLWACIPVDFHPVALRWPGLTSSSSSRTPVLATGRGLCEPWDPGVPAAAANQLPRESPVSEYQDVSWCGFV
ncbi:unnamed protein product, partial [Prorocentrum cordatum]